MAYIAEAWFGIADITGAFVAGIIFGPYPEGAAMGHGHYGWAIWGAIYLMSIVAGVIVEKYKKRANHLAPTE